MSQFLFDNYTYDNMSGEAAFSYRYGDITYREVIKFDASPGGYNHDALDRVLFMAFMLIGTSYYKAFPVSEIDMGGRKIDEWQAAFFSRVYQEGLSQFAYENNLSRRDLAHFHASADMQSATAVQYDGRGVVTLQSGGKDSLLLATILQEDEIDFSSLYISSTRQYPEVIDAVGTPVQVVERFIDRAALSEVVARGGRNGHVPVTYIVLATALIQAVLDNKHTILAAIGHEGEEPHAWIDDLPVNHQWSKTWQAEQLFAEYVKRYISPDIRVGSPLRKYTELRIAELFVDTSWQRYGDSFSSCNTANYGQGVHNQKLSWCGRCPKCANSYILFAPFVDAAELKVLFNGRDLFADLSMCDIFKGLLGVDGVMKPFECVGEVDELRRAYHMAQSRGGYEPLSFIVPESEFDYRQEYDSQKIY